MSVDQTGAIGGFDNNDMWFKKQHAKEQVASQGNSVTFGQFASFADAVKSYSTGDGSNCSVN